MSAHGRARRSTAVCLHQYPSKLSVNLSHPKGNSNGLEIEQSTAPKDSVTSRQLLQIPGKQQSATAGKHCTTVAQPWARGVPAPLDGIVFCMLQRFGYPCGQTVEHQRLSRNNRPALL